MSPSIAISLGSIAAIAVTIVLYVMVIPKKFDGSFGDKKILQFFHDLFNFKKLYIESVLKFVYTLATCYCVCLGVFFLITVERGYYSTTSYFGTGVGLIIAGPIAIRLAYELLLMMILLVKNVIEINNKLKGESKTNAPDTFVQEPVVSAFVQNTPQQPTNTQAPNETPTQNFNSNEQ